MEPPQSDEKLARKLGEKFELKVTANDIRKCNQDMVQKIYMHFLRDMGASLEQIKEVPFSTSESVQQYPDMYRAVMHTMGLARVIQYYLHNIYNDNSFTPADLYDPKPKRTRRFFVMLLEYVNQSEVTDRMIEIEEQVYIKREKLNEMQENLQKLQEKVHQQKLENAELKIQEVEEEKRIAEGRQKMAECLERKSHLQSLVENKKITSFSLDTAIKEAEMDTIRDAERVQELRAQVVLDSERVEIDERENHLAHLKTGLQEKKERLVQMQHKLAMIEQSKETLATMMATLQDIQQEHNKEKECLGAVAQLSQDVSATHEQMEDKDMQMQHLNLQIESHQAKISQIHQTWKMNKESILEEIKQQKLTLEESRRNKIENEIAFQDMENEHTCITNEISQFKEQISHTDNFISSCYQKILVAMDSNNKTLESTLVDMQQSLEPYQDKE